jgi:ACS family hexuronate transporter-like MFS transporter
VAENGTSGRSSAGQRLSPIQLAGILAGRYRWIICGLLFLGVTKNYMDRQVLSVLKTPLQQALGWDEIQYGHLVSVFQFAYAAGMLCMGRVIDWLGTRVGYAVAMVFWSIASMAHAAANSFVTFAIARGALGFGEAGVFPSSLKTVAEWFPKKERALATGIFNAGTSVGAMITPLAIPKIAEHLGWRWAFVLTGGIGFLWLILWLTVYRKPEDHPGCTKEELVYIQSDPAAPVRKLPWLSLLQYRQTWTVAAGKFITDPVWWFFLFWIPDYMQREHGLTLGKIGIPIFTIYLISDVGSVGGGWISSSLMHHGFSVNTARKTAMLVCAILVLPIALTYRVSGLWPATLLIGLAAAAHQGFSANMLTMASDLFPARAVGSVSGIAGMAGAAGGMLFAEAIGHILQWKKNYKIPFMIAASAYLVGVLAIHLLSPRLAPAEIAEA